MERLPTSPAWQRTGNQPLITMERIRYQSGKRTHSWWNSLDVYFPQAPQGQVAANKDGSGHACPLRPILVFVGGGGWQGSDHVNDVPAFARDVVSRGFVCVVVRHRPAQVNALGLIVLMGLLAPSVLWLLGSLMTLSPLVTSALFVSVVVLVVLSNVIRGTVPLEGIVQDCAVAIGHIHNRLHMASYGGDHKRLVLCGNSSGGHLMMTLALDHFWLSRMSVPLTHIAAVLDISGLLSFEVSVITAHAAIHVCTARAHGTTPRASLSNQHRQTETTTRTFHPS